MFMHSLGLFKEYFGKKCIFLNKGVYRNVARGGYRKVVRGGYRKVAQGGYRKVAQDGYRKVARGGYRNFARKNSNFAASEACQNTIFFTAPL